MYTLEDRLCVLLLCCGRTRCISFLWVELGCKIASYAQNSGVADERADTNFSLWL